MNCSLPQGSYFILPAASAAFSHQSGVVDGDDEVKERLQPCPVPRRILLNLYENEGYPQLLGCDALLKFKFPPNKSR